MKTTPLENWVFTQVGGGNGTQIDEYLPAVGPTTVHVELLKAKRIPDPVSKPRRSPAASSEPSFRS